MYLWFQFKGSHWDLHVLKPGSFLTWDFCMLVVCMFFAWFGGRKHGTIFSLERWQQCEHGDVVVGTPVPTDWLVPEKRWDGTLE